MPSPRPALLCLAAALALAACTGSDEPTAQRAKRAEHGTGPVVVGAAWPWEARKNVLYAQGMELAVDELNQGGGVLGRPLSILKADDHENVDEGRLIAQQFGSNPDVVAVIGHLQSYV